MEILWVLYALIGDAKVELDRFERPGDCTKMISKLELEYPLECIGGYERDLNGYSVSRPSWMTDEQANELKERFKRTND